MSDGQRDTAGGMPRRVAAVAARKTFDPRRHVVVTLGNRAFRRQAKELPIEEWFWFLVERERAPLVIVHIDIDALRLTSYRPTSYRPKASS